MGFLEGEGDLERIADLDLVGERDLGDEVDAVEIAMDVVFVAEKLGDRDLDGVGIAQAFIA